jgi:hypothetical protein
LFTRLWKTSLETRESVPQAGISGPMLWKTLLELWITAVFVDMHTQGIIHRKTYIFLAAAARGDKTLIK